MGALLDLLKSSSGEESLFSLLGQWRQAVSTTTDNVVTLINNLTGGGLAPATGTTQGARPLVGYSTSLLLSGAQVFVQGGIDQWYWWDPTSTLTADQLNVVRPTGLLVGAWIRESVVVDAAWFVDSVNGSDQNTGTSSTSPIQTLTELSKRFYGKTVLQDTTITDVNPTGSTFADPLVLECMVLNGRLVTFVGATPTQNATGSITAAFVTYNPAINVDAKLTDGTKAWAGFVGKRLRMTSGAAVGAITWVMKDLGANTARVGQFVQRTDGRMQNPIVNDTYAIETLVTTCSGIDVQISGGGQFRIKDSIIAPVGTMQDNRINCIGNNPAVLAAGVCVADGCQFQGAGSECDFYGSFMCWVGCKSTVSMRLYNCQAYLFGHVSFGFVAGQVGSRVAVLATSVSQGGQWAAYDQSQLAAVLDAGFVAASIGVFDRGATDCFETDSQGMLNAAVAGSFFFGSGNTTPNNVVMASGCLMTYISKPVVTGTGNDARVGGTVRTWAQIPYFNGYDGITVGTGNGAAIVAHA